MQKLLKDIEGFDDVGIGVIWQEPEKGKYILCNDLKGFDLSGVQIYRYNNFFKIMRTIDSVEEDTDVYAFCVKREDLV